MAGAAGVLSKDVALGSICRAVRGVAAGEAAVPRALVPVLLAELRSHAHAAAGMRPVVSELSDREWQVLDLLCAGAGTQGMAEHLAVSVETVRSHVKAVFRKLGVSSRAEAVQATRRLRGQVAGTAPLADASARGRAVRRG